MFLNDVGQPLILSPQKTYSRYEQHDGPLLLTKSAFQNLVLPSNWCRIVLGSMNELRKFRNLQTGLDFAIDYRTMRVNVPIEIKHKNTAIELTLISAGQNQDENLHFYLVKTKCTKFLITDALSDYLDFIPKAGACFHRALHEGIDVMYIDDLPYRTERDPLQSEAHQRIYALVQLIRPKRIHGLREENLPKCLLDLCVHKDVYAPIQ